MASFWDKAGGAAKWITDPKQLLTAAGFVLGGPVGAGAGRAVGGMVPQSAGPVPWGALGANTDEFRQSTLADGLQWEDVGQAGKDFASGYSAGQVGQQIPGLRDLEGAFAGGAGAGQSMGVDALPTPDLGSGVSSVGAPPMAQQSMGGPVYANPPMSAGGESMYQGIDYFGGGGGDPTMRGTPLVEGFQGGLPQQGRSNANLIQVPLGQGQRGMGTDALTNNNPDFMTNNNFGAAPQTQAQTVSDRHKIVEDVQKGKEGGFWGGMNGMERMYAVNMMANLGASMLAGEQQIGQEGVDMLGGMGLFSPTQRRPTTSFDEWRSQRGG